METESTWFIFGANILLSFAGLAGYALFTAGEHLNNFDAKKFWNGNKVFWIWAFLCQILYVSVMSFFPELEQTVAERLIASLNALMATEWEINQELTTTIVYLTGTWQLSRFAKRTANKDETNKLKTD